MMKKFAAIMILAAMLLSMMTVPALASAASEDPQRIGDFTYTMPRPFYYDSEKSSDMGCAFFAGDMWITVGYIPLNGPFENGKLGEHGKAYINQIMSNMFGANMNAGIQIYEEHTSVAGMEAYSARAMGMADGRIYPMGFYVCYDNYAYGVYVIVYNSLEMQSLVEQFLDSFQHV